MTDIEDLVTELSTDPTLQEGIRDLIAQQRQEFATVLERLDDGELTNAEYADESHAILGRSMHRLAKIVGEAKVLEVFGEDVLDRDPVIIDPALMDKPSGAPT
jgi:hypothetical protein